MISIIFGIILFLRSNYPDVNDIRSDIWYQRRRLLSCYLITVQTECDWCRFSESSRSGSRLLVSDNWGEHDLPGKTFVQPRPLGVTVVHLAFPLRLIMQFSTEAFFIAANSHVYFCPSRAFVRHPICISHAPFRDLHSSQPQCFRRIVRELGICR